LLAVSAGETARRPEWVKFELSIPIYLGQIKSAVDTASSHQSPGEVSRASGSPPDEKQTEIAVPRLLGAVPQPNSVAVASR
jgi:hypothetical protein